MATAKRRDEWHRTKNGSWACSLGSRGTRVRLLQKRQNGPYWRAVWLPDEKDWDKQSLCTSDQAEARRLGELLLAELLKDGAPKVSGRVTLGQLWRRFRKESEQYLDNSEHTQRDAETRAAMLIGHFGEQFDVSTLTRDDVRKYARKRRAGGITYRLDGVSRLAKQRTPAERLRHSTNKKREFTEEEQRALDTAPDYFTSRKTRARSAEADLALLDAMLLWATTVRTPSGQRWLDANPMAGITVAEEKNPKRPIATWDRYEATRQVLQRLAARELELHREEEARKGKSLPRPGAWVRWVKIELALVLAEATGRRLGAIRQLRWEDIDFDVAEITWQADADKENVEWVVPMPDALVAELRAFKKKLGAIGGWVFVSETDAGKAMDRHLFDKWLTKAEQAAGLPKLNGGLWHPYRRKWAMERKHLPIRDVAAVGGWKDLETLLKCYSQPDRQTMLDVMDERSKLRDVAAGRSKVPALSRAAKLQIASG